MLRKFLTGDERSDIKSLIENKKVFLTLSHRNPNAPSHELYFTFSFFFFFYFSTCGAPRKKLFQGLLNLVPRSPHSSGKNRLVNPFQGNFAHGLLFIY